MKTLYDRTYYENGIPAGVSCYTNFRWLPELTIPMAARMVEYLHIGRRDTILDFGCAKGYLVKALRLLGREAWGCDISEYALSQAPIDTAHYLMSDIPVGRTYDWIIAKDVFEHIPEEALLNVLSALRVIGQNIFVIVPLGSDGHYFVPSYDLDKTHCVRRDLSWWHKRLEKVGWFVRRSTYRVEGIKDNYADYPQGNGFLVAS